MWHEDLLACGARNPLGRRKLRLAVAFCLELIYVNFPTSI